MDAEMIFLMPLVFAGRFKPHWWFMGLLVIVLTVSGCSRWSSSDSGEFVRTLPVYPGADFLAEFRTTWPDDTPSRGITYETTESANQVYEFYQTAMLEKGWSLTHVVGYPQEGVPWQLRYERDGWWSRITIEELPPTQIRLQVGRR